jgi:hypothetical protein
MPLFCFNAFSEFLTFIASHPFSSTCEVGTGKERDLAFHSSRHAQLSF